MSGTENATATMSGLQTGPGVFQYTITLTDTGTTAIGTFWFAWDDVPDQDFMNQQPSNAGSPAGWNFSITQHAYTGGIGYGIEWIASTPASRININGTSSAFTFTSTETPAQMAAVSPFDNTFQTTSGFVYQGGAFVTPGGNIVAAVACFREGTRIRTPHGDVAVESLRCGDHVVTAAGESRPLRWIGQCRVVCDRDKHPQQVWPVRIAQHALGPATPAADLYLSPDHAVFLEGVLVPAKYLINGTTIVQTPVEAVTYHHLELDSHDVILAEGAPTETYLDTGDRAKFDCAGEPVTGGVVCPHPGHARFLWETASCMPLVVTGPVLTAIRRRLANRADWLATSLPSHAPPDSPPPEHDRAGWNAASA